MGGRKKILLFADWYEPGYKAGGPIRSCVNFAGYMREDYQVYVFTSDRDLGSAGPYEHIKVDEWHEKGQDLHVYYCSPEALTWRNIRRQMEELRPDFIYLNSMFSVKYTILPLLISRFGKRGATIILSPRGMLRSSAVQFKSFKKKIFLNCFRWFGFHRGVHFLVSDDTEAKDVGVYFGKQAVATLIPNFPSALPEEPEMTGKERGRLSMIFVGRIHPIKGLDFLLKVLKEVEATVDLTLVGSLEDPAFWATCKEMISGLPANISVTYAGEMPNHELPAVTGRHHVFVLPTKGENFGHAIFEALALGKPVLISDQTPWRGLEAVKAGWDLPLDRPELFREAIGQAAAFGQEEYDSWCGSTRDFVKNYIRQLNLKDEYQKLFS